MPTPPDEKRPAPLDYEQAPRGKAGAIVVVCIVAAIYGVAIYFCIRHPFLAVNILIWATIPAAIVAGVYYGTQDKKFWC